MPLGIGIRAKTVFRILIFGLFCAERGELYRSAKQRKWKEALACYFFQIHTISENTETTICL